MMIILNFLFGNTATQPAPKNDNGILRYTTIALALKYFWRSLEMPLIHWKVELKLTWTKHCLVSVAGNDNVNGNNGDNKIVFRHKFICSRSNFISKRQSKTIKTSEFERSVYWNEYKTKSIEKNTTNKFRFFLESNSVKVTIRLFILVYTKKNAASKRFKAKRYYLPKGIIDNNHQCHHQWKKLL